MAWFIVAAVISCLYDGSGTVCDQRLYVVPGPFELSYVSLPSFDSKEECEAAAPGILGNGRVVWRCEQFSVIR